MGWKNNRPDNWERCTIDNLTNYEGITHAQCYEAGADAMLGILKANYTFSEIYDKEWYINRKGGRWVYIPDGEQNGKK